MYIHGIMSMYGCMNARDYVHIWVCSVFTELWPFSVCTGLCPFSVYARDYFNVCVCTRDYVHILVGVCMYGIMSI